MMSFSLSTLMPSCPRWLPRDGRMTPRRRNRMCPLISSCVSSSSSMMSTSSSKCLSLRRILALQLPVQRENANECFSVCRHAMTKHQYYLQLRKDILEERMRCDINSAMILASLALQAEFGDYQPEVLKFSLSLN